METTAKPNWLIIAISAIFLAPPAYSIFQLLTVNGGVPFAVGLMGAGGIDLLMVMAGYWALQLGEEGVATWPANLAMVGLAVVSIVAQLWHAAINGTLLTGVVLATLAVGGVLMIEGQLRRVHRINARRDGRLSMPRARVSLEQWFRFGRASNYATSVAVAHPDLDAESVFALGMAMEAKRQEPKAAKKTRRSLDLPVVLAGLPALMGGQNALTSGTDAGQAEEPPTDPRTLSDLVREGLEEFGADQSAVTKHVLRARPDAVPDTIRKTYARLVKPYLVTEETG